MPTTTYPPPVTEPVTRYCASWPWCDAVLTERDTTECAQCAAMREEQNLWLNPDWRPSA